MKTFVAKKPENRKWYIVNAEGKTLGKLAVEIAKVLRGKNKADFTPHVDTGDYVIVQNADKFHVTGNKMLDKKYYRHSRYAKDGLKTFTLEDRLEKIPTFPLEHAVAGMLPNNKLKKGIMLRLKLVTGTDHKFEAQKPEMLNI
ncbi:50S ribosomal protein L13 [Candidatus Gracilibacteria bacterium]|nr:50S ribosomal protein L13 [Candidatus Gracilibacteria bacterium]